MKTSISIKDLEEIRGYAYVTAQRRLKKVRNFYKCHVVTIGQYCEFYNENYVEMYAQLNTKTHKEYIHLYTTLKQGVLEGVNKGVFVGV